MSDSVGNAGRANFLPVSARDFLQRRVIEAVGLALAALAVALLVAFITFNPADPSFNRAASGATRNLLGAPGAYVADFALQTLGIASLAAVAVLFGWSWRLVRHHQLPYAWLRLILLAPALALLSAAIALLPTPAGWPASLGSGLGGYAGQQLRTLVGQFLHVSPALVSLAGLVLAGLLLYVAAAIPWQSYWAAGRRSGAVVAGIGRGGARLAGRVRRDAAAAAERRAERVELARQVAAETALAEDEAEEEDDGPREPHLGSVAPHPEIAEPAIEPRDEKLVAERRPRAKPGKRAATASQATLDLVPSEEYALPPLDLLGKPSATGGQAKITEESLEKNARLLESVLDDFGVKGQIVKVRPGPVVTLYELEPAPGTKTSRVVGLADDVARSMSALAVRIAVIPGRSVIGIELPNQQRETVHLRELLASADYERSSAKLALVLGKDIGGAPIIVDLARMPHLLIAGTTGSGKSVAINTMILSLIYRLSPEACKFIMVDPKMLELSVYDGIPHLLSPVVTDPRKAIVAVKWAVREMENRYRAMSKLGVRNIEGYNQRIVQARSSGEVLTRRVQTGFDPETGSPVYEEEPFDLVELPFIVVVVDEMADLMLVAGKEIEAAIQRLAQMARAAGIHIIMATQRPSVDVITGTIKANFPTRISFHVTSRIDSRTILGETGAEQLLGQGDMLYMAQGGRITRVHGPFVSDHEVEAVVKYLKLQGEPTYVDDVTRDDEEVPASLGEDGNGSGDDLYDQAVALVSRERKASTSFVQRHLQIGYNRAARLIERMEKEGVVTAANHVGKREVLARDIDRLE
jgi:S-DNA-T family DNA segregation ATPase FtsK/SpoIIIE